MIDERWIAKDLRGSGLVHIEIIVVKVPGYRSRGPDSIPDTTRFSEK
jgi:hypothetical protein